jgi:hypothetical protein
MTTGPLLATWVPAECRLARVCTFPYGVSKFRVQFVTNFGRLERNQEQAPWSIGHAPRDRVSVMPSFAGRTLWSGKSRAQRRWRNHRVAS